MVDAFLKVQNQPVVGPARKVLMSSANLRSGMRLAQDLVSAGGSLLLAQGYCLDDHHVAHIRLLWMAVSADDGRELRVA